MLLLIIKIMVIVVLTSKIVDVVEDKGHRSLWVKIGTPVMWIVGEVFGSAVAMLVTGMTAEAMQDPMAQISPEYANAMFLLMVLQIAGALVAVGCVYLYARSLKTLATAPGDTSFR